MKKKLLLISPKQRFINYQAHSELAKIFGKKRLMIPLALPTIAALTPDSYEIKIIDEEIEPLNENYIPDVVGITTLSATINRAYELGDFYRKKGAKVIFGGPAASYNIDDSLKHADSTIIGEAEGAWENCLADIENNSLQKTYKANPKCEYETAPIPRWDLVPINKIFQVAVQASRGCPFNCDFCLVSELFGRKMRHRNADDVVKEVKALPHKWVFFVDDNFAINKKQASELVNKLKPLGISWACQCSIDVANDELLLKDMAESGCYNILIGFESLNSNSLAETNKTHNKQATIYKEAIEKIHKYGIHINASFVVGFDNDTLAEFDNIYNFTLENGLVNVNLHTLSAVRGTKLYDKMKEQGRLPNLSTDLGVGFLPNLNYINMTRVELFDKYMQTITKLHSWETLNKKALTLFSKGAFTSSGADISVWLKMKMSFLVLFEFILSPNKHKRKAFTLIRKLISQDKLAVDKGLGFLMYMLGINRHINKHKKRINEYRAIIK